MKMKNIFLLTTVFIAQNFLYSSDKDFKLGTIELHGNQEITKKSDKDVLIEDIMSQTSNFSVSNECKGASFLLSPIGGVVSLSTSLTDILGRLSLGNTISSFFLPASNMLISSIFVKFSCFDYMNQEKKKNNELREKLKKLSWSEITKEQLKRYVIQCADETIFKNDCDIDAENKHLNKIMITLCCLTANNGASFFANDNLTVKYSYLADTIISSLNLIYFGFMKKYNNSLLKETHDKERNEKNKEIFKGRIEAILKLYDFQRSAV